MCYSDFEVVANNADKMGRLDEAIESLKVAKHDSAQSVKDQLDMPATPVKRRASLSLMSEEPKKMKMEEPEDLALRIWNLDHLSEGTRKMFCQGVRRLHILRALHSPGSWEYKTVQKDLLQIRELADAECAEEAWLQCKAILILEGMDFGLKLGDSMARELRVDAEHNAEKLRRVEEQLVVVEAERRALLMQKQEASREHETLAASAEEIVLLQQRLENRENAHKSHQQSLEVKDAEIRRLENSLLAAESEDKKLQDSLSEKVEAAAKASKDTLATEQKYDLLIREHNTLQSKLAKADKVMNQAVSNVKKQCNEEHKEKMAAIKQEAKVLRLEDKCKSKKITDLLAENTALGKDINAKAAVVRKEKDIEITKLKKEIDKLNKANVESEQVAEELEEQIAERAKQTKHIVEQNKLGSQEVTRLNKHVETLETRITKLYQTCHDFRQSHTDELKAKERKISLLDDHVENYRERLKDHQGTIRLMREGEERKDQQIADLKAAQRTQAETIMGFKDGLPSGQKQAANVKKVL